MILVVGASGFLGGCTARRLLVSGHRVRASSRDARKVAGLRSLGAEIVEADLVDKPSLEAACRGVDAVFVAAHSMMGSGRYAPAAVDGAGHRALVDAARRAGIRRFVYTSAMFAAPDHPIDFLRTKAATEAHLRASGLPFAILRPSAFMEWHVDRFIGTPLIASGKVTLLGPGSNPINFVAADDVAAIAVAALLDGVAGSTIDIGGPDNVTRNDVAGMYATRLGRPVTVRHVPLRALRAIGPLVRPFRPGLARVLTVAAWSETCDQTYRWTSDSEAHRRPVTHVRDFVAAHVAASSGAAEARDAA
jgi:uncharacterized protein YbjT (DUF2867 family)